MTLANEIINHCITDREEERSMKLSPVFTSHAVLAADKPIRIFGDGGGSGVIRFAGEERRIVSSGECWQVEFPPMEPGGPYVMEAELDGEKVVLDDIRIGTVILFAGQSNMQLKLRDTSTGPDAWESMDGMRLYSTARLERGEFYFPTDGWVPCRADEAGNWSAIAYLAGRELLRETGQAVGAIACYQGASVIESWMPAGALQRIGIDIPAKDKHPDHFSETYSAWNGEGTLYGKALSQVVPYAISAVVWYQGESDTTEAEAAVYAEELCEMIRIWRRDFADEALPFVVIQIADFAPRDDAAWHTMQLSQAAVEGMLPHVYSVRSSDICEDDNIHPPTKDVLSHRVASVLLGR